MMMVFEEYFSFEAIVRDLVRWRVAGKGVRGENGRTDVEEVLPPRKMWSRAGVKERKGDDPADVRKQSILRTILHYRESKSSLPPHLYKSGGNRNRVRSAEKLKDAIWGRKLMALVEEVQTAVFSDAVAFEKPKMRTIEKGRENGVKKFREVASFERLMDRVILSRMMAYVRDVLEGVLGDCCYSFRRDPFLSHQLAIARLQEWRREMTARPEFAPYQAAASMFVAECDIVKFFDSISHDVVRRCWEKIGFDERAGKVLEAYLAVYAVEAGGALGTTRPTNAVRRGLPQGGSLSTVLANLVLHEADMAVREVDDGRLFYARYCDDVVFAHPDKAVCRRAMEAYMTGLAELDLPMHPVRPFVYKPADGSATEYYTIKSKGPFQWGEAAKGEPDCAPWVSFLGSQVRYDGETRIRKESIEKHIRSLGRETAKAVRELQDSEQVIGYSEQIWRAWFARFRNRLIAKGVGYVTAKVKDCNMCWAGAFTRVTDCADTKMQMRRLDRVREGMLCKVWNVIQSRGTCAHTIGELRRSRGDRPTRRYKGRPFSYYGFLEKATRPTNLRAKCSGGQANMAYRRRFLLYSEL